VRSPPKNLSFFNDDDFRAYIDWYYDLFQRMCSNHPVGWELARVDCINISKYFFRKSAKTSNKFLKKRYNFLARLFWKWAKCFERGEFPPPYSPPSR
jgi:hypothetical protein